MSTILEAYWHFLCLVVAAIFRSFVTDYVQECLTFAVNTTTYCLCLQPCF